jgi:hydroxyacylglutathione hydrolase
MLLQPLPAFADNYIWTLRDSPAGAPVVVDPGDAAPVLAWAEGLGLVPAALLLTHHHRDHVGGAAALLARWPGLAVFAPEDARIEVPCRRVGDGDVVETGPWRFEVLEVPGHTSSHIAFHGHGLLFCGDTLFSLGCGRMFEGTPAQMLASLDRLAALPPDTRVCCGHEYTLANAAFAAAVDPDNPALRRRTEEARAMRDRDQPTLPATLAGECAANPFLRVDAPAVRDAVALRLGHAPAGRVEAFAGLRRWKDGFAA